MTYLKKLIGITFLTTEQGLARFSPIIYPLPLYLPLTKDRKIKWLSLIIAGSLPLYKGDGSWDSTHQKNRHVNFSRKKEEVLMRE